MNVVDIIVVCVLLFGGMLGLKRGFTKALVSFLGLIILISLSYILKNPIASILYTYLPFFQFGNFIKGGVILNILVYEWFAFAFVFSLLFIIWKILLWTTSIFEKVVNFTIILGIPSKILGMLIGFLESFLLIYVFFVMNSFPIFEKPIIRPTKLTNIVITKTPILSSYGKKATIASQKFLQIKEKYKEDESASEFNLETLDLFLEYKIVSAKNIEKLVKKGKLKLQDIDSVLQKYK